MEGGRMVRSIDMKMAHAAMLFSVLMTGCAVDAVAPQEADLDQADVDVASSEQALEDEEATDEETRGGGLIGAPGVPGKTDIGQGPIKGGLGGPGGPLQGPGGVGQGPFKGGLGGPG